ncbi:MAG TPA: family 20 glycosylhydrolase [Terriglobales bacterium]|nr:family 20 glycosylhydrolase [Terriglobales bacterium]
MRTVFLFALPFLFLMQLQAQTHPQLNLMPLPAQVKLGDGELQINPAFSVATTGHADALLHRAVERFLSHLRQKTGMTALNMSTAKLPPATLVVEVEQPSESIQRAEEDESYSLTVAGAGARLHAQTVLGAMHGLQTFLQLVEDTPSGFAVPVASIQDAPRFPWRGLMIDASRHFMPVAVIERNLDGMEAVKLNVLHWHLSDDQGFRVESKKFPKLQELGSDGLYYTQKEIREVIAYARDRGIRVVPEFDIPGHTTALLTAYPEFASAPGPFKIERNWGVFNPTLDPTREATYKFLDALLGEMASLFPDHYFHIGGDEVNGKEWNGNANIREFKRVHHLATNDDLQAYFNQRVERIVTKYGKTMIGWDEILRPNLPRSAVIQSWRGAQSLAEAAKQGHRGILSAGFYLDLAWPASQHYAVDPMPPAAAGLTAEEQKRILGAEACMWAEYVSPENVDSRIWPRMAAIAERFWSPQSVQDIPSMYSRLEVVSRQLDGLGLTHNTSYPIMLRRIAGEDDISNLRALADVVEPTKGYTRMKTAAVKPTALVPLNRLVDAARPESVTARHFSGMVDAFLENPADENLKGNISEMLEQWHAAALALAPLEDKSFLMKELAPVSQSLGAVSDSGSQALQYFGADSTSTQEWKSQQLAVLDAASQTQAQVTLAIAPAIRKLVEASGGTATASK